MALLKSKPTLLIIDMQNGFVHPSGTFGKMGMPLSDMIDVIHSIQRLREIARKHNLPIMYTRLSFASDYSDCFDSPLATGLKALKGFIRGIWDANIVDELNPAANEIVMDKTRSTAFWKTQLEEKMTKLGVNQLIVAGVGTNVCVESTVRDAFTHDVPVLVVSDATAALTKEEYEASLKSMRIFGQVADVAEIERELAKGGI
jgi:ureidoacrylate peracid hydrolase